MNIESVITTLKRKTTARAAIIAVAAIVFSLNVAARQNPSPNGRNVNRVDFGTMDGRMLGACVQVSTQAWVERHENGTPGFSFNEVNRDDWSVYLHDPSRNVSLQLDLHTRKVMYSDGSSSQSRPIYTIVRAS